MARQQSEPPLKPIESLLAEANAQALAAKPVVQLDIRTDMSNVLLLQSTIDDMPLEELRILAVRLACQCGLVAKMTDEQTAQAMLDTLAETALRPIAPGLNMKADVQARLNAIDKWLDRKHGKPAQTQTVGMYVQGSVDHTHSQIVDNDLLESMMLRYLEKRKRLIIENP